MRILDDKTFEEVENPDLTVGAISAPTYYAPPEAYETVDVVTKFALYESDYERVQLYHVYTAEEIAQREEAEAQAARQAVINAMPETLEAYATETDAALFDLDAAKSAYETETDAALFDLDAAQATYEADTDAALFDLAEYVATLEVRIQALEA